MNEFSIQGRPEEYYVAASDDNGGVKYTAVRSKIRLLVESFSVHVNGVAASGGNPYTASLDLSDKIKDFISGEPAEAQLVFYDVYTLEMNAVTASTNDETKK